MIFLTKKTENWLQIMETLSKYFTIVATTIANRQRSR